jgi:hypothetical protein
LPDSGAYMIPGHPNTVRSSPIPLYLQGFNPIKYHLGQDDVESAIYDGGLDLVPDPNNTLTLLPSIPAVTPMDTSSELSPGGSLISPSYTPPTPATYSALQPALTPSQLTQIYQSAGAAGTMTPAQVNSAIAQLAQGTAAVAAAAAGPAPRVAVPAVATAPNPLTASTIISGVPNYLLLAAAAIAAVAMGGK